MPQDPLGPSIDGTIVFVTVIHRDTLYHGVNVDLCGPMLRNLKFLVWLPKAQ